MPIQKPNDPKATPAQAGAQTVEEEDPVEVVLEQADKLKSEIAEMEEELKAKRRQLQKFEEARKLFESA